MNDSTEQGDTGGEPEDPTAPRWPAPAPSQPVPSPQPPVAPPSPYAAPQLPAAPDPYASVAPGQDPYGQDLYGGQAPYPQQPYDPNAYGPGPYGPGPYGQAPYSMPPAPYGAPPAKNTSAIVLTVVSAVTLVACCNLLAIPSLVLGIIGINKSGTDPQGAARLTKAGWITFAVTLALVVIGWVTFFALAASGSFDGSTTYEYEGL